MVVQDHPSGGPGKEFGMRRARVPRWIYAVAGIGLAALATNAVFGDKSSPAEPFRIVTPGADKATEISIQGQDGMQSVLVVLPGGTHAVPVGFKSLKDGLRVCQDKPLPYDAAAMLQTPQEVFANGCAADETIRPEQDKSTAVAIPGRDVAVHVELTRQDGAESLYQLRATVGK